ncbi:MAG: hypothetical protein ACM3KR_02635 [Deltaproteobacteria bacterium]
MKKVLKSICYQLLNNRIIRILFLLGACVILWFWGRWLASANKIPAWGVEIFLPLFTFGIVMFLYFLMKSYDSPNKKRHQ